jgi:hypothetical protein
VFAGDWVVRGEADAPSKPNALCHFKPISGREDQAAGIIFRVQDKDYYILRANALEANVNLYQYASGPAQRHQGGQREGRLRAAAGATAPTGSGTSPNDQKQRAASRPLLDALYAYCQKKVEAKAA